MSQIIFGWIGGLYPCAGSARLGGRLSLEIVEDLTCRFDGFREFAQDDLGKTLAGQLVFLQPPMGFFANGQCLECHTLKTHETR